MQEADTLETPHWMYGFHVIIHQPTFEKYSAALTVFSKSDCLQDTENCFKQYLGSQNRCFQPSSSQRKNDYWSALDEQSRPSPSLPPTLSPLPDTPVQTLRLQLYSPLPFPDLAETTPPLSLLDKSSSQHQPLSTSRRRVSLNHSGSFHHAKSCFPGKRKKQSFGKARIQTKRKRQE